jgi:hypothetical protein
VSGYQSVPFWHSSWCGVVTTNHHAERIFQDRLA